MKACGIFHFDATHYLPDYGGACERLHGHTYRLEVEVEKPVGKAGMVLDFGEIKKVVETEVIEKLDHQSLNGILPQPTAEKIAEWVWSRLAKKLPLSRVRLWEGEGKWVEKTKNG